MARILRLATVLLLGALGASGCYAPRAATGPARSWLAGCPGPRTGPRIRWHHRFRSAAASSLFGEAHHAANDPVVNPGDDALVRGKFAYGAVSKDLEREEISLWLEMSPCGGWEEIASDRTDGHGRVAITVPTRLIPAPGAYRFQLIVRGDLTRTDGVIYVLERGTRAVVFDIDGTITTGDDELVEQLILGMDPEPRPGAAATVRLYARAGYLPIYISGRPHMLRDSTRDWLSRYGFPRGIVITTASVGQAMPGEARVGHFKEAWLEALRRGPGVTIAAAYGNAPTDLCAYARAGIDPRDTFIVGKRRGQACPGYAHTQPIDDYRQHVKTLAAIPAAR